jgi:hypothetical protein
LSGFHQNDGHGRAAGAQDALVQAVELFALFGRLQALLLGRRIVVDQVRLDRVVLLEELGHVDDQVADDRQAGQRRSTIGSAARSCSSGRPDRSCR